MFQPFNVSLHRLVRAVEDLAHVEGRNHYTALCLGYDNSKRMAAINPGN